MGNSQDIKVCCNRGICPPQYEITLQDLDCRSLSTPSPTLKQNFFKSLLLDPDHNDLSSELALQQRIEYLCKVSLKLKLQIRNSSTVKAGTEYILSSLGYTQSKRPIKDGFCYFGVKKNIYSNGAKSIGNDIIFPIGQERIEKQRGQHFCIYYDLDKTCYMIKDFSEGFGTFYKLKIPTIIRNNFLLFMAQSYFLLNISEDETLSIKALGNSGNEKSYKFSSKDCKETCVKIGRNGLCDIVIEDSLASKVQCCLNFNKKWTLFDGDGERESTNGVWVYINEPLEIVNGMCFKSNHTIFEAYLFN